MRVFLTVFLLVLTSCYGGRLNAVETELAAQKELTRDVNVRLQFIEKLLQNLSGAPAKRQYVATNGKPSWGASNPKVTIIKAFEFACGYCYEVRDSLRQIVKEYPNDVRVVFMQYLVHPKIAEAPAKAACAADRQGKYTEMFDAIWDKGFRQQNLDPQHLRSIAAAVGLDMTTYENNLTSCAGLVRADHKALANAGIRATPSFLINGNKVEGAVPYDSLKEIVEEELKRANEIIASQGDSENRHQLLSQEQE